MSTEKKNGLRSVHKTSIGGQAVIEGIMMRSPVKTAMSVRKRDGQIQTEILETRSSPRSINKIPFIRGIVSMVLSLKLGFQCILQSADIAELGEEETNSKSAAFTPAAGAEMTAADCLPAQPKAQPKKQPSKMDNLLTSLSVLLGVVLAIGLFMVLPTFLVQMLGHLVDLGGFKTLIEGIIKIGLFVLYMWLVSFEKDIGRTYEYHGAEHKSIACYEAGEELTVENVRKHSRFHPRCGTSFIFLVLILSILLYSVVSWDTVVVRVLLKLALLPVLVGVSYELIRLAGKYDNVLTRAISAPGLWLQRLTTKEPSDDQIEVAIVALSEVIPDDPEIDRW